MMKKIILFVVVFALCFSNYAQEIDNPLAEYEPVTPNTASLGVFGGSGTDISKGKAEIGVPLYTIETRGFKLPISLQYQSSGIKVNDLASWVGLGWTLNAGGAIIRNVKGTADNINNPDVFPDLDTLSYTQDNYNFLYSTLNNVNNEDSKQDLFIVRAPGVSGTFRYNQNAGEYEFIDLNKSKLNIISEKEIEVTSINGDKYRFGTSLTGQEANELTNTNTTTNFQVFESAYYLTEIITKDGDVIKFFYKSDVDLEYSVPIGESNYSEDLPTQVRSVYQSTRSFTKQYLTRIEFPNGYLSFNSTKDRQDLLGEYKLNYIEIFEGTYNSSSVSRLKRIDFNYNYFNRSGGNHNSLTNYPGNLLLGGETRRQAYRKKSLKLNSIDFLDKDIDDKYSYKFTYNNTSLPERGTTAQDYWGYANSNTGTLLTPTLVKLKSVVPGLNAEPDYMTGTGDRSVNENKMKAAILEKIEYPTGGYTMFDYEANRFQANETQYELSNHSESIVAYGGNCNSNYGSSYATTTFTIPNNYYAKSGKITIYFAPVEHNYSSVANRVVIDGEEYYGPPMNTSNGSYPSLTLNIDNLDLPAVINGDEFNFEGEHTIEVYQYGEGDFSAYGCPITSVTMSWKEIEDSYPAQVTNLLGGLRLKNMMDFDDDGTLQKVKSYDYEQPNIYRPMNEHSYVQRLFTNPNGDEFANQVTATAQTNILYDTNIGSKPIVEYSKVIEYERDIQDTTQVNGKTVYYFENVPNERILVFPTIFFDPQYGTSSSYNTSFVYDNIYSQYLEIILSMATEATYFKRDDWKCGTLLKKEIYKKTSSGDYKILKSIENLYSDFYDESYYDNYIFSSKESIQFNSGSVSWPMSYNFRVFYFKGEVTTGRRVLNQTKISEYNSNEIETLTIVKNFTYANPDHLLLTAQETVNSGGIVEEDHFYYPQDLEGQEQSTAISNLISDHRLSEVIKAEHYYEGEKVSEQHSKYGIFSNQTLVSEQFYKTGSGSIDINSSSKEDLRLSYHAYDDYGNPLEVSKAGGAHIFYLWGYHGQYPIAKIENTTKTALVGVLGDLEDVNESDLSAINTLRNNSTFKNTMITTYDYDPLIGISVMKDARGRSTSYEYDAFGRLKLIKDHDGKLLEEYKYHYKGE